MRWGSVFSGAPHEVINPGYFANYYHCGSTIGLWSEALTASAPGGGDIFALWRSVFSASDEMHYDDAIYYARAAERSSAASALRTFVETRIEDPDRWIVDALTKAGVQITQMMRPPIRRWTTPS